MKSLLTVFEWTPNGSEDYRRAAIGDLPDAATATAPTTAPTTPATPGPSTNAGVAAAGGEKPQSGNGGGPGGRSLSKSSRLFNKFGSSAKVFPEGVFGGTVGGGDGNPNAPQRRATHAGVVDTGTSGLRLNMLHFTSQEFMDPDTAAQVSYESAL